MPDTVCPDCARTLPREDLHVYAGVCDDCLATCDECGTPVAKSTLDDFGRCEECAIECASCGCSCDDTDASGRCEDCALYCSECDACVEDVDEYGRCDHCTATCQACGETIRCGEYCDCCMPPDEEDEPDGRGIYEYGYEPAWTFHNTASPRRDHRRPLVYFGLEVEVYHEDEEPVPTLEGWVWKHDSSIGGYGAEAVSHPRTWDLWRRENFAWLKGMQSKGWRAYDAGHCGLHVHVSRTALTRLEWYKILVLFQSHEHWLRKISRRRSHEFTHYCDAAGTPLRKCRYVTAWSERYQALNASNRHTMEFRLFRGTTHIPSLQRNLHLVVALLAWAQQASLRDAKSLESFHAFLGSCGQRHGLSRKQAATLLEWSRKCA